ncbi:FAD-dependent oxidoreductase [Enterobacter sp. ENT03]|uniref:FAD-dependent oxidoreductase n=1 Tax=Enterobacter sp. ENT03 TaxID=2854780 RepID=UPI001C456B08|nr:FAD-dependent oxidoreductase [Enterobacter sp. ENT03]MBV7404894.1 FAD-dependent oxidoreductase [Enterobacter sp. ENT03]
MKEQIDIQLQAPVYASADVVVTGAGPAGVAAAIAAARAGKQVILLERSAQPGGMATLGNVSIFMTVGNLTGIYKELIGKIRPDFFSQVDPHLLKIQFNPLLLRYHLNEMLAAAGVTVLFHADVVAPLMAENQLTGVLVNTREGLRAINGKVFIDATGDAHVAQAAGVRCFSGRESDGLTQPMTLMFQMQNTGSPVVPHLPEGCYHYERVEDLPQGRRLLWELKPDGTLIVNMTRIKGNGATIKEGSDAEREGLKQVFSVAYYLQRNGFENYILSHVAAQTGVRESRRIEGLYTLTEADLLAAQTFSDVVAQTNYAIDIHSPDGAKSCDERKLAQYDIPYRCLVPQGVEGLLVAGRAISTTHVALSSVRVMPTCFALGQAAGIAAALAIEHQRRLAAVPVDELHAELARQGVMLDIAFLPWTEHRVRGG